jgi:kynurenine formamidase
MRLSFLAVFCCISVVSACAPATTSATPGRVVDLGHALSMTDPSWTGERVFSWEPAASIDKDGYFAGKFSSEEHFGTHVDAPAHFAAGGMTVDQIPADRLVRPGKCINVAKAVAGNEDYRVSVADVEAFEREHGRIADGDAVLIATGWDSRWPDQAKYMNVRDNVKHFPGLSVEAASLLAKERHVAAILIDTGSIDYGPSEKFEAHHTTMPAGLYHVENAANLTSLPAAGFTVVVAPIKLKGGSGGPTRVFALLEK